MTDYFSVVVYRLSTLTTRGFPLYAIIRKFAGYEKIVLTIIYARAGIGACGGGAAVA